LLAGDAELFRELVHAGLACHCSPLARRPAASCPLDLALLSQHTHGAIFTAGSCRVDLTLVIQVRDGLALRFRLKVVPDGLDGERTGDA